MKGPRLPEAVISSSEGIANGSVPPSLQPWSHAESRRRIVYALYYDTDSAKIAIERIRFLGIEPQDIVIVTNRPLNIARTKRNGHSLWYVASGGAVVGLAFGIFLTVMTETAWPLTTGNMPIVTWWSNLVITFELTMLGSILATAIGFLVSAKLPGRQKWIGPSVDDGRILVGIEDPRPEMVREIEQVFQDLGGTVTSIELA
jgi:hypothetical protein